MQTTSTLRSKANAATFTHAADPAHTASVKFDPAFLALADDFGMVPERMAERVLSAFAATPPSHLIVKGRKADDRTFR